MLGSGTLISGFTRAFALLSSPVGRFVWEPAQPICGTAATSLKGDVSFPALSVLPPYPKPPLLSLSSHRVSAVCGNWENPQCQHGSRAPRGHQSAGKALPPFSLVAWHGGAAPTAGDSTRMVAWQLAGVFQELPVHLQPHASTLPASPALLSLGKCQPRWGWDVPGHSRGKMLHRSPSAADTLHFSPLFASSGDTAVWAGAALGSPRPRGDTLPTGTAFWGTGVAAL